MARARRALFRNGPRPLRARYAHVGDRSRVERRLSAPPFRRCRYPVPRDRADGEHGRGRRGTRHPRAARILRQGPGREARERRDGGGPGRRQQRLRPRAGHRRLHRRSRGRAEARRRHHPRVPPPDANDRGRAVRHCVPRTLLLPFALHDRQDLRAGRIASIRRRATDDARRKPASLRLPRQRPPGDDGGGFLAPRGRGAKGTPLALGLS